MGESKSSISKAQSYKDIGEFWDSHDLAEYWNRVRVTKFDVDIQSETTYYPLEPSLSVTLRSIAKQRGISPEILLNLWVQEKAHEAKK